MPGQYVITLSADFELEFIRFEDAQEFLGELTAVESAYRGLYGVSDETTLEIREVAYHYNTSGMPIRYFID